MVVSRILNSAPCASMLARVQTKPRGASMTVILRSVHSALYRFVENTRHQEVKFDL